MDPLVLGLVSCAVGLVSGIAGGWLTARSRLDRIESREQEREENRKEWRSVVGKRLDSHAERMRTMADHETRLKQLEIRLNNLSREFHKHIFKKFPPRG